MDKMKKELVRLCADHPDGLSIFKIHRLYQRVNGRPLHVGTPNRLEPLDTLLRSMPDRLHLSSSGLTVWPVSQMSATSSSSSLSSLASSSSSSVAGRCPSPAVKARTVNNSSKALLKMEEVLENIVAMMKQHPEGIPLKKLTIVYSQKYRKNLAMAPLGFKSTAALVDSLGEDLVVEEEQVFHKIHRLKSGSGAGAGPSAKATGDSRPATPQRTKSQSGKGPPLAAPDANPPKVSSHYGPPPSTGICFGGPSDSAAPLSSTRPAPLIPSKSKPTEELTQEQLLQRVLEVMKEYPFDKGSMGQLQACYTLHFGQQLPMEQYMSLYDSMEASRPAKLPAVSEPTTSPWIALSQKAAAMPKNPKTDAETEQKQAVPSNALSDSDFPVLGAEVKRTKDQKRRMKDEAQREGNTPVFRDAYHAQLRQVHGDNMRAAEALQVEEEDPKGRRRHRVAQDPDTVNSLVEDVIRDLAAEGELVTQEKVISRVCVLLQVPSLEASRINAWTIPTLKDLKYTIREINMFIQSTEVATAMCTLYELGQSLAALKNKKRFEELNLGPLCKQPLIQRMFKIASDTKDNDIHQIETVDILRNLRIFRKKENKPKVDLAEFMKYLADQYSCETPYELGIRIQSVGLPISALMKVTRSEHTLLEGAQQVIQRELEEEVHERLRKMKRSVMEPVQGATPFSSMGNFELRKKYVSMTAAEVVLAVFTNAVGVFTARMAKRVQDFLLQVSGDRLATALFQLAICEGSLAAPQDLVPKDKPSKNTEQKNKEDKPVASLPSEATVKQYLKDSLSSQNSAITLAHISSLERKLTKHFQIKEFITLEQGTFLEFLVKHIQLLLETVGGTVSLSSSMELQGCGFRPSRQDVFEFIKQCGAITPTDPDGLSHIESALRAHYRLRDSRDLGFGPLRTLAGLVQRQRDMLAGGGLSQVYYESALFANHSSNVNVCESVGLLGEVAQAQALASLLSCPLLEDLGQWSQWELVFKPVYGPLKDFIERKAANTDLAALEVLPGLLLRITTNTGDKLFSQAAMSLDPVGTAGHLVSIVVADGIVNAPMALLANDMQSALAVAVAKEDVSQDEEDVSCYGAVARFLLECLIRIPIRTCQALLQQVFLEPFSRVLGQAKSKQVLLSTARSNPHHLNCLHQLGILLGITDWVRDFHSKLTPPQIQNDMNTVSMDQTKSNLVDSGSSSLSALNLSEDDYLEDTTMDYSFSSSHLNQSLQQADGEQEEGVEEEDDEEELYELTSVPNGEIHISSEAEGSQGEGELEKASPDEEDGGSSQSEITVNLQRDIIEDIRKSEFGIGVELTAQGQKLMQVHQDRLGRSLDRLSTELYSKDTHFVLELIQNADDNSYPSEAGATPALAFVVERDCITVLNNESGFQEKNIRAICDVGRSTKGKHKYGYIGQKGIGFKSVFKVTNCPEIHSNGFHLRFDKTCGPMGYILPHWMEDERPLDTQLNGVNPHRSILSNHFDNWTTKICLPLRSESHQTRNLFHDVHPSLLLFLHRLRSITIYSQSEKRPVTMTRRDLSHNVLEVEHTEGTERWLVVKRTLQPKKIKEDVEMTELALAFQLGDDITGSDITCQPQKQPVFAFLPLRSFGFRFIIQGDFDIPSSREDVDRDSSWNQWLRSEIPQLFLQAMDVFADHPEFSGLKGLCHFLQFAPLPDEVLDFFKPVAGQIIQLLKGKAFLPTLNSDGDVAYKLPSQVAVCQDSVIRDVIGADELDRHLSLAYLYPGLRPAPPTSLLTHLGVRHLRGSDVTTVTTAMAKELTQGDGIHTDAGLRRLARLLVCNFRALEHGYGEADSILQALRDLPIIPLADGRVVALSREGVFFPMEKTTKKKARAQTGPFSALYEDVSVVHPSLLDCVEPLEGQQVRELLRRLGVHELEPQQLLEQHIYPAIRNGSWKSKQEPVVVSYLVFIKQHSSSSQEYSDAAVPVLTNRGLLCPALDRVHFSEEYGNIDLPKKLPGCDWVLLSPCYVKTDGDVAGWRELFTRLGVRDHLIIRKERRTLTAKELASSPWSKESGLWQRGLAEGGCVLDDYPSEEFHDLATAQLPGTLLLEQRRALLELLETNWDTGDRYSQYLTAQLIDSDGQPIKSIKSSFSHFLSRLKWVPAYRLLEGGQRQAEYLCPNSVYLMSNDVHSLLGTHVCYVDTNPSEFSNTLGMRHSVTVEELINYLKKWCVKPVPPEDESEGSNFSSTVEHIYNVYSYLHRNCSQSSLKELFQHTPAVFIEYNRRNDWCSGRFYHLKEVCWSDATAMFKRYKMLTCGPDSTVQEPRVLAPFYSQLEGMRDFFIWLLNVEPSPNMNQYVGLLELICSSSPIPSAEVLQDVSVLYATLAHKCKIPVSGDQEYSTNASYCSTLKGMVSDIRVFPTTDNRWVSLAHRPMIADSKELESIFKPHKQVCLLNLPAPDRKTAHRAKTGHQHAPGQRVSPPAFSEEDRSLFLEICGIRQLSQCVDTEAQTENLRPCPSMQSLVRLLVPYIQRFLYHHNELASIYPELLDNHIGERIKRLCYGQVGKLYIRYQLSVTNDEDSVVEIQDVICLLKDKKELYIQKDHLSAKLDICRELVKLFCTESGHRKELMNFLSGIIASLSDPGALKRFLLKEDVRELPCEEELWEVPEPPKPEIKLERVPSKTYSSVSASVEQSRPEDGEQTLACWPPRASILNTGVVRAGGQMDGAVEAVMKMWPPPAPSKDIDPERDVSPRGSSFEVNQPPRASDRPVDPPSLHREHSHPFQPHAAAATPDIPRLSGSKQGDGGFGETTNSVGGENGEGSPKAARPNQSQPSGDTDQPAPNTHVPEAVVLPSMFQGTGANGEGQRPVLALDSPLWNKVQPPQATLEDMELTCQRPTTVVLLSDDPGDLAAIGQWGEQLVNSFLCHWKDSGEAGRPAHILWCNQHGESGQPYDFKLTFEPGGAERAGEVVYVEVKSTVKREKAFINLSANELDFALKEKERYHIFRVYSTGDAQNVRLCRIQNLAQHLHAKDLELFLFV